MKSALFEEAQALQGQTVALRRDIHRHPELGLHLPRTRATVLEALSDLDLDITLSNETSGIVATLHGARPGPSVLLRGDMDALPMPEQTGLDFSSTEAGCMHACGHDAHTANLLGVARVLAKHTSHISGKVLLIFQPGEEGFAGGEKMIQDGMFDDFKIDEVYALHNWPELPLGTFGVNSGPMMAAVDEFDITVKGKGGHAASPHLAIDPVVISAQVISAVQTIISRSTDPVDKALISITKINAGTAYNVIDDQVKMGGTIRTFRRETRAYIEKRLNELCKGIADAHGAEIKIEFDLVNKYPPTINSKEETKFAANVAKDLVGDDKVITDIDPSMGGEDFSYLLEKKPGSYLYLGQGDEEHSAHLHTTKYDFNDNLLPIGVNFWVDLVQKYFSK